MAAAATAVPAAVGAVAAAVGLALRLSQAPRLRLANFDPDRDGMGVVKPPEFSYGPAAYMRLTVQNTSRVVRAEEVRVLIDWVRSRPSDSRYDIVRGFELKWAARSDRTLDLEPGERQLVDLMKLNAAWTQAPDERTYRAHTETHPPRASDVPQDRGEVWTLMFHEMHDDGCQVLRIGREYDIQLTVKARHTARARYTTRLACDGWPARPPWPYDTAEVWRSFRLAEPLTRQRWRTRRR
jgi:hypothetical protein